MKAPSASASSALREPALWLAMTVLLVGAVGGAFLGPALAKTGGHAPIPLDDVYIHFGFARSAALGHPFAWLPDNGYSSGGTSLTYPLALAPLWLVGLRGERLAIGAAAIAWLAIVDLARSLRRLVLGRRTRTASHGLRAITWAFPALVLAVPLLDWSLFSGMETAFLGAVLGRALLAARRATEAAPAERASAQRRAGLWAAALAATRPELAPLALLLALGVVHGAGSIATWPSLARSFGPVIALVVGLAVVNRALTGEWSAAGAVRKLATSNPYLTSTEVALEAVRNLAVLRSQAIEAPLGGPLGVWLVPALAAASSFDRSARRLVLPLLGGAFAALLLVSLNTTARFQNLRYAAPTLLMLLAAAAIGAGALARRGLGGATVAGLGITAAIVLPARAFPRQVDLFARASANIAGQQVEVARRLAAMDPPPRLVFVNDAGAIPYLSGLPTLDGLGLGGFHGLPFARASVLGVPAVVELLERLAPRDRPDVLAVYASWWPGLEDTFGTRLDAVRIEDNVICGDAEKVIDRADWSALAEPDERRTPDELDALDVGDILDERAHAYVAPVPAGGWILGATLRRADGRARFDAGRIVPEGRSESFTLRAAPATSDAVLIVRTDPGDAGAARVAVERDGAVVSTHDLDYPERAPDVWHELRFPLGRVQPGDRVRLTAIRGALHDFHGWVVPLVRAR